MPLKVTEKGRIYNLLQSAYEALDVGDIELAMEILNEAIERFRKLPVKEDS